MLNQSSALASLKLQWSAWTNKGRFRPNNEDAFLALSFDAHEVRYLGKIGESSMELADFVFAVSDGMGGANSGEFASRLATQSITRLLPRNFRTSTENTAAALMTVFRTVHAEMQMHSRCYEECRGMGATLSLCWFMPGTVHFAHIGDSRIYRMPKNGSLTQLSHDHTHVGWMHRQGQLNERELRAHPRRNVLNQALGAGQQFMDPQISSAPCQPGDRFLICSDGLIDGLWDSALLRHLSAPSLPENIGENLVRTAIEEGSKDNVTAMVIDFSPLASLT